jgi:hypothetical protein
MQEETACGSSQFSEVHNHNWKIHLFNHKYLKHQTLDGAECGTPCASSVFSFASSI